MKNKVLKFFLAVFVCVLILVLSFLVLFLLPRNITFPKSAESIQFDFNSLKGEEKKLIINDPLICSELLNVFNDNSSTLGLCKCKSVISMTIRSASNTKKVRILSGHDNSFYEFFYNKKRYRIDLEKFLKIEPIRLNKYRFID